MESLYLPILVAATVALFVWGVAMAIKGLMNAEKRKLQQRLIAENDKRAKMTGGGSQLPLSITRNNDAATGGASALISRWSPLESLHRTVVQAYPNGSVATFL